MKKFKEKRSLKKDIPLIPGYLAMAFWIFFVFVAFLWIIFASLSTTKEIFSNKLLQSGFHFINYYNVFIKQKIWAYFLNSIIYSFSSCFLLIIVSAPAAYVLARKVFRGRKFLSSLIAVGLGIPAIMIIMPLFYTSSSLQLVGTRGAMILVIIIYVALNMPFTILFLSAFFVTIPSAMEEAAVLDGCTPSKAFWKIILPLAQSGIVTVTIFNFLVVWNEYFIALIFANTQSTRTVSLGLQSMVQSMVYSGDWAGLFTAVCIVFIPTVVLYLFLSKKIIAGITTGAVKS